MASIITLFVVAFALFLTHTSAAKIPINHHTGADRARDNYIRQRERFIFHKHGTIFGRRHGLHGLGLHKLGFGLKKPGIGFHKVGLGLHGHPHGLLKRGLIAALIHKKLRKRGKFSRGKPAPVAPEFEDPEEFGDDFFGSNVESGEDDGVAGAESVIGPVEAVEEGPGAQVAFGVPAVEGEKGSAVGTEEYDS